MLVILNLLIVYFAVNIFETMKDESWLNADDFQTAISSALSKNKFKICVFSVALMVAGLLFVLLSPATLKYVATNVLFIPVVALAMASYVIPFVWSLFITDCKKRQPKVKVENK